MATLRTSARAQRLACLLLGLALAAGGALAADSGPQPASVDPTLLKTGEFEWYPEASPVGPLLLVVSLTEQRAFLYRNGVRIAVTTLSSGKRGKETPPGVYSILQKQREHYSNLYDSAPMPFMQRLTWGGVALHAGHLPGYPASHGCIRLPKEFARRLYEITELGMTVVVAADPVAEPQLAHPGWLAPPVPGAATASGADAPVAYHGEYLWQPELSPTGPLTLLISTTDRQLRVLRNGVEIGHAEVEVQGSASVGTQVLQLRAGTLPEESRFVPGKPRLNWTRLDIEGSTPPADVDELYRQFRLSPEFAQQVYGNLVAGTTIVITDLPLTPANASEPVLDAESGGEEPQR